MKNKRKKGREKRSIPISSLPLKGNCRGPFVYGRYNLTSAGCFLKNLPKEWGKVMTLHLLQRRAHRYTTNLQNVQCTQE